MTVKIGLLGCGGIARAHAQGYLKVPEEAQITAVSDVVEASTATMAAFVSGDGGGEAPRRFADFRVLIAEGDVDAVDICLPHHLHADAIVAAAGAGKHILCEKPLCTSLEQAAKVEQAVKQSGVTLMCAHNQLFEPAIRRARAMLDEGALGRVYEIRTVDTFVAGGSLARDWGWRARRETMGGGELIDTGYHPTYMLLYLAGSEPVEVTAMLGKYRVEAIEGEDSAQVLVRFADGAVGNIVSSWAYDVPAGSWQFQVIGERGQLYGRGHQLYYKPHGFEPATVTLKEVNGYHAEVADFAACLREKRTPIQTEADGIKVLKVILGAYRAQTEKRTVELR